MIKQTPRYPPPQPPVRTTTKISSQPPNPESEKLKKYSEDISRKKSEEEFLRSSLRGSKKLQQLEQKEHVQELQPVVNPAFEPDDDFSSLSEVNKGMISVSFFSSFGVQSQQFIIP